MSTAVESQPANDPSLTSKQVAGYLALVASTVILLLAIGVWPTRHLGGTSAVSAMVAGCGASALASLLASVPVWAARGQGFPAALPAVLGSHAIRMAVVLALGITLVVAAGFAAAPLLLWIAIAHGALLAADVRLALKVAGNAPGHDSER